MRSSMKFVVVVAIVVAVLGAWAVRRHLLQAHRKGAVVAADKAIGAKPKTEPMGTHMVMTQLRPAEPGDDARAEKIVGVARQVAAEYADYHKAEAAGYQVYMPEVQQAVYHFVNKPLGGKTLKQFDLEEPPSLLYAKTPKKAGQPQGYKMVGVMYIAPYNATEKEIDARAPLSVARWHLHTDICVAPKGNPVTVTRADGTHFVGTDESIKTEAECKAAGGTVKPHSVWMVHVYPNEKTPE